MDKKKANELPPLIETLAPAPASPTLELDELWSFVQKSENKQWVWIAQCRDTRQVVAYYVGDRSQESCRQLWERIPGEYRQGQCYSDFWAAYRAVLPDQQHSLWQGEWADGACGAMEQHAATTDRAVCPQDVFIFQMRENARVRFAAVSASLQSSVSHLSVLPPILPGVSHYQIRNYPPASMSYCGMRGG